MPVLYILLFPICAICWFLTAVLGSIFGIRPGYRDTDQRDTDQRDTDDAGDCGHCGEPVTDPDGYCTDWCRDQATRLDLDPDGYCTDWCRDWATPLDLDAPGGWRS